MPPAGFDPTTFDCGGLCTTVRAAVTRIIEFVRIELQLVVPKDISYIKENQPYCHYQGSNPRPQSVNPDTLPLSHRPVKIQFLRCWTIRKSEIWKFGK